MFLCNLQKNSGLKFVIVTRSVCKTSAVHKDNIFCSRQPFKLYHRRRKHTHNLWLLLVNYLLIQDHLFELFLSSDCSNFYFILSYLFWNLVTLIFQKGRMNMVVSLLSDIDATGRPHSGVSTGNLVWLGSYVTCKTIPDAHYCLAPDVTLLIKNGNKSTVCIDNSCTDDFLISSGGPLVV